MERLLTYLLQILFGSVKIRSCINEPVDYEASTGFSNTRTKVNKTNLERSMRNNG